MNLSELIYDAGVVGAGGAGFPTHIKAKSAVEFMVANGAECEPLLHKDFELMVNFAEDTVKGMSLMIDALGAKKGFYGIKTKNAKAIEKVKSFLPGTKIEITELGDFYPSGDEYELVYSATGRLIPPAGLPLQVGTVVNNVESLYHIAQAAKGIPVTKKFLCVTGAVRNPQSFFAPIGMTIREAIEHAGGTTISDFGVFVGGVMMGRLTFDLDEVITKTSSGFIVLPKSHQLITRLAQPEKNFFKIGKSACDQCSYCTEFCPRYLLGYNVQPHKVMRSLEFNINGSEVWNQMAELCCSCGLCTLYSCPEDLFPREACDKSKKEMRSQGVKYVQPNPAKVHPMKEGRRVPLKRLIRKLNLQDFESHTPYNAISPAPTAVKIMLKQHVGDAAIPCVNIGDKVNAGDCIAAPAQGKLGSKIHASISGMVKQVTNDYIRIKK